LCSGEIPVASVAGVKGMAFEPPKCGPKMIPAREMSDGRVERDQLEATSLTELSQIPAHVAWDARLPGRVACKSMEVPLSRFSTAVFACALTGSLALFGASAHANAMLSSSAGALLGQSSSILHDTQVLAQQRGGNRGGGVRPGGGNRGGGVRPGGGRVGPGMGVRPGGPRPGVVGRPGRGGPVVIERRRRGIDPGAAAAIGLGIGVLGAIAAGQAAASPPPPPVYHHGPDPDAIEYCMQRFRSYNPETGLYRGFDGILRPCP